MRRVTIDTRGITTKMPFTAVSKKFSTSKKTRRSMRINKPTYTALVL
jgi:hypothetical protein